MPLLEAPIAPSASSAQAAHIRVQLALRSVALGVSAAAGGDVFAAIAEHAAQSLGADFAFVSRLTDPAAPALTTLAVYYRGELLSNMTYALAGTPCQHVFGRTFHLIEREAQLLYPDQDTLQQFNLHSYAGYPLFAGDGRALGLIAVAHSDALTDGELIETLLKIFSVRAAAELERLAAEASYRAIFDASEDSIFVHDFDSGRVVDVNPKACHAYGYSHAEMLSLSLAVLDAGYSPYTSADAARWLEKARREPQRFEWRRRSRNGDLHWDEVILKRASIDGVERIVAITRDISVRKRAEEQRAQLEQQLRQAQRMEAIGHLTGGIAHDFNNLLTGVLGYTVMAQERAAALRDERLLAHLEHVLRGAEKARDLIQQMLTFSRGGRGTPQVVAADAVVGNFLKLIESTLPATVEIEHRFAASLPPLMIDPVQLEQVLMNLCINARDAMRGVGRLAIELRTQREHRAICASCLQCCAGDYVALDVRDNGPGIEAGVHARMFEPFFSTKESGKGSGMGLAMVHGIVHECGGHVLVQSAPRIGTTFRVLLPALRDAALVESMQTAPASPGRGGALQGRVAVVDDEPDVAGFMAERLGDWGLEVQVFCDPVQALPALQAGLHDLDLVILDQSMPRLAGLDLARQLLARRSDLPVLLYTGYSDVLTERGVRREGVRALLKKPVDQRQLQQLLQKLLRRRRG